MKHKIISLAALLVISITCYAQSSMTDDQVMQYILKENEKGTSQQKIVTDLIKKGVTTVQLQRVRRKAEHMKRSEEMSSKKEGNKSKAADDETSTSTTKTRQMETGSDTSLNNSTIEDMSNDIAETSEEEQRQVFGRNIFSSTNLTFQASGNMATPQNYILGPGDQVVINVWGASQQSVSETVSADGYIVVPNVGQIKLAGMSVSQAKAAIRNRLGARYGGSSIDMSVTDTRTIQVQVMGEVKRPGTYSVSGLSSAFNALYTAGGISNIGTLRDIKVYRNGHQIASIDVYDYLLNGNASGDVRLRDNDVIVVGAYDCLVQVSGNVKRPMWYEMKRTETVGDLIRYCGGFNGDAYTKTLRLLRKSGTEYSIHTIDEFQMNAFKVADEDRVEIDSIRARFSNIIEVRGAAKHPGKFQLGGTIMTVKDLLIAADGLSEDAYTERAIIHRQKDDLSLEMVSVDIMGIINGTASDVPLKNNDVLFIPNKTDMLGERELQISGEVVYPGKYPFSDNTTIRDLIIEAGGLNESASLAKIDVFRRILDPKATKNEKFRSETFTFSLDESFNIISDTTFILKPYDHVVVRKSPGYTAHQFVYSRGEFNFPGQYAMNTKEYRLSDLVKASGGLTSSANIKSARLTRQMNYNEVEQRNRENLEAQIEMLTEGMKEGNEFNATLADSILVLKKQRATNYTVSIDLEKAMKYPGSEHDIILREYDFLDVMEHNNVITVSGEVMQPTGISYEKGRNLYYYINNAGGFTDNAKRSRIYGISQSGAVTKLHANSVRDIEPGMNIVVPQKSSKKKMNTAEKIGIFSGIASLAAVIVAVLNVVKK